MSRHIQTLSIRSLSALSLAALACAFALAPADNAHARQLGDISVVGVGPWQQDPTGGYTVCTAHLRRPSTTGTSTWEFHTVSANSTAACLAQVNMMSAQQGWSHNPNPGRPLCACTGGFFGFMTITGDQGGPLGEAPLSEAGEVLYHEGLRELRERYRIAEFAQEHDLLLEAIRAVEPPQE